MLIVNGTTNESMWQYDISTTAETSNTEVTSIATDNLTDNAILTFKILISNNVIDEMYTETTGKDICKLYTTGSPY